ncbi:MAG TPA: hypothetical protein VGO67_00770 [Verrucomicrobiae bacterium]
MKTISTLQRLLFTVLFCLPAFGPGSAKAQTSNTCISPLNADFVTKYEIIEAGIYVQTNSAGAVPIGTNNVGFEALIKLATNLDGTASVAILSLPGGQPVSMKQEGGTEFVVSMSTDAFTNIAPVYPDGTYQFTIFDNTVSVTLPDGAALPNPPTLSNFDADQSINARKDYTLSWEPFMTGGKADYIDVTMVSETNGGTVFQSGEFGCPGLLDGSSTSIVIPANTLASNTTYRTTIQFIKVYTLDTNSIPATALLAGTETELSATISTGPVAIKASAPVLANAALLPGVSVRFDFSTTPGLSYTVQFNSNLSNSAGWTGLQTTEATGSVLSFTNGPSSREGFFRVLQR